MNVVRFSLQNLDVCRLSFITNKRGNLKGWEIEIKFKKVKVKISALKVKLLPTTNSSKNVPVAAILM